MDEVDLSGRGVMSMAGTRTFRAIPFPLLFHMYRPNDGFESFDRDGPRTQNDRRIGGTVEHSGLNPLLRPASVEKTGNAALQIFENRLRAGGTGSAGAVGRRGRNGRLTGPEKRLREIVPWDPHADSVPPGRDDLREIRVLRKNESQRSGTEPVQQPLGRLGQRRHHLRNLCPTGKVNDERVVRRPSLGLKDGLDRLRLESIGPKTVDRLGRKRHEAPLPKHRGGICGRRSPYRLHGEHYAHEQLDSRPFLSRETTYRAPSRSLAYPCDDRGSRTRIALD